ncbi:CCCH like finger domain nucleoporin [Cryptosporidium felis]|nr:CCCH like finger domain nucleoporin [Cryptosporidium felis]
MSNRRPCQFFLRGSCRFGDNCRDYHPTGSIFEKSAGAGGGVLAASGANGLYNPFSASNCNAGRETGGSGNRSQLTKSGSKAENPVMQTLELVGIVVNSGVWPFGRIGLLNQNQVFPSLDLSIDEYRWRFYQSDRSAWSSLHLESLGELKRRFLSFVEQGKAQSGLPPSHGLYNLDFSLYSKIGNWYLPNLGKEYVGTAAAGASTPFGGAVGATSSPFALGAAAAAPTPFGGGGGAAGSPFALGAATAVGSPFAPGAAAAGGPFGGGAGFVTSPFGGGGPNPPGQASSLGGTPGGFSASLAPGPSSGLPGKTKTETGILGPGGPFGGGAAQAAGGTPLSSPAGPFASGTPFGGVPGTAGASGGGAAAASEAKGLQSLSLPPFAPALFGAPEKDPFPPAPPGASQASHASSGNSSGADKRYSSNSPDVNDDNAPNPADLQGWELEAFKSPSFENNKIPEKVPPKSLRTW